MLFNLEYDHGNLIEGYLIPDGFSDKPQIRVSDADGELMILPCDQVKQAVIDSGRHEDGLVGFRLDTTIIPDLTERTSLMIHDAKSGLLIYRRPQVASTIPLKIVRLEAQLLPMVKFDYHCGRHFQYELSSVERFGHETTLQAFHLNAIQSIYISGRLLMRNYEEFFDKGFKAIALLTDPYYELALRIFLLKRMAKTQISFFGDRDKIILAPAAEHFAEVNLEDEASLKAALKKAPQNVTNVLASPLTRQLATTIPEQAVTRSDVATAIDLLSRFAVVGFDTDSLYFQQAVSELIGISIDDFPLPPRHSTLEDVATRLRSLHIAELMLEEDLIFDHYVRQAMKPTAPELPETIAS
ncbi:MULTISPECIES: hypothetical protein [unclassified Rhizobium]|uniref:hypothetical protein n=1 Tax=unclassified Rhizobium TaxID=2613769 RepID=UPI0006482817|nr:MULTISPECIES: hypothetical protein [unclassified Rhizobium]MBN8950878.1 hypothetical protein [Rhizobium tropici]OJY69350.1 MAG: hypothetical protein BGP09_12035 [Rhizobium sp. 60-20]RKD73749.1 hypothetical protein BJ928_10196 [Rhizobium sp. WW_1]